MRTLALLAVAVLLGSGCASVPVYEQTLVSKPNMLFSDSAVLAYNTSRLLGQLEPGFARTGGQNSGCSACR